MAKGLYKRGEVWWIRYAGLDGRIVRESSGSTRFRDAEALLLQRRNDVKEGKQPEVKRITNGTPSLNWRSNTRRGQRDRGATGVSLGS